MNYQTQFRAGTWSERIYKLGQATFEKSSNKEIADMIGCDNQGIVSRERKTVSQKTGWIMAVGRSQATTTTAQPAQQPVSKPRKQAGSLPVKIQGFLEGTMDDVPESWFPEHVFPVIDEDSVSWNRFIRRMVDLDSVIVESFEKWLGRGATMSRQASFDAAAEAAAQWDRKALAESLARELLELGFDKTPTAILREIWV